ncbi:MAG: hypothetical protein IT359_01725 [Gemmatimonadaceae bacterium]|nr:hypothetical protein [Gemmatimonadaceae bacterium]
MHVPRITLPRSATLRATAELATPLRTLPEGGTLVLDTSNPAPSDTAALQLLLALRQGRVGPGRGSAGPDGRVGHLCCAGIDPLC